MQDVVVLLSSTFRIQPTESGPDFAKFVFSDGEVDGTREETMHISVRSRRDQLEVAFTFREYVAMLYVAEFIEGPLFTREESENLYGLIYSPAQQHGWEAIGRFHAKAEMVNHGERTEARFGFAAAPSGR
jgi:hypothetical protein